MRCFARMSLLLAAATAVILLPGAPATAATPSADRADGNGGRTQAQVQAGRETMASELKVQPAPTAGPPAETGEDSGARLGALPFTGTDLALAACGAVLLFVAGAAMARFPVSAPRRVSAARPAPIRTSAPIRTRVLLSAPSPSDSRKSVSRT
jgi:hypothetical protein